MDNDKEAKPCTCECHTADYIMHARPCCEFAYQKFEDRHPNQETIDFVGSLINRE